MLIIPDIFKPRTTKVYPPYNKMVFEEYFMNYFLANKKEVERIYLPIMWTNFYIKKKYGTLVMRDLQNWLNKLNRGKKYFTVLQYDDGILQDLTGLDILIFGAGGGGKRTIAEKNLGIPIPLICQPSLVSVRKKDILCSFVGTIKNHRIRRKINDLFGETFVIKDNTSYGVFIDIMERSIFSLCPRGYGATSFRICESLQHGSIPIYVYNNPWIPFTDKFDFDNIGIAVHEFEIPDLAEIVESKTETDIQRYLVNGEKIYDKYFTYEGCAKEIINML